MRKYWFVLLILCIIALKVIVPHYIEGDNINWSEEEIDFIKEHKIIKVGIDPDFIPFEFIDNDGKYKGIAADYLSLISKKTGISFEIVSGLTWPLAYEYAINGDIDMLAAIGRTKERESYFLFSKPYFHFKRVIVTRNSEREIKDINDLYGKSVAVQRNSSHHSYLLTYPYINLNLYDSVVSALTSVSTGSEIAFIGNLTATNYIIRSNGLSNLRMTSFEAEKDQSLHFAVHKELPELIGIINKALDNLTINEKAIIHNKWVQVDYQIDYSPIIRVIIILTLFITAIFTVSLYWIIRLRKEVDKRKIIQSEMEKAKIEAEDANKFKSSFMARMSHEIRTPLNAITGMSYLLKKTNLTLTQKMYADRITQASTNMLNIINDILDLSKIEAGRVELDKISFSLDKVIQDVVNIISYKIEEQAIGFKLSKDSQVPNWFFGDSKRIGQILLNVLNNAAKFTIKGEVSLEIRLIAKENEKYHLSFTIKDTGIGMTEDQVAKLFLPFTQGDSSISRRFGGSGLGLSIVKNLLELMEGQIQVYSTFGEGTTIIINISLVVDKEKENEYIKKMATSHFKNLRTLVLEKTGSNINLIESYLSAFGMQCELTTSERSAINMLESADGKFAKPFDLIIVDYETPIEGGFQYVEYIRNNRKIVKKPKVIMLVPMMREDLFDRLNENGIDIGIGKPIIPSILFNGILEIFKLKAVSMVGGSIVNDSNTMRRDEHSLVLIAEDNKTNQLIAQSLLHQSGIDSILASDGFEAVELYKEHRNKIQLILMDLHMPIMNGYDAAHEIRKISSNIPIVAMTADVVLGVKEKCIEHGINYYISKPFEPDYFIEIINTIFNQKVAKNEGTLYTILDKEVGLKNMGGDKEAYYMVLKEYHNENINILEMLTYAINERRFSDASQIVHKIKSSSSSIGAKELYELLIKLQKVLEIREEEEINKLLQKFHILIKNLLNEIIMLLDEFTLSQTSKREGD